MMHTMISRLAAAAAAATLGMAVIVGGVAQRAAVRETTAAQPEPLSVDVAAQPVSPNAAYDGRFTFARIRFAPRGGGMDFYGRGDPKWSHDYPTAERNFSKIIVELSTMRPYMEGGNVFTLDDPELFKHPIAYLCEPGFWNPTEEEAAGLRAYLQKGGFIIFDDFFGRHWENFEAQMQRVLPQGRLVRVDPSHPIFDSFFKIEPVEEGFGGGRRGAPEFWGIFEDNDPDKRLLAIVNFNNDIGESWEYSDTGLIPVDVTSVAYKLGMNYLMYGMTH
ncbi:MAG: DUF4159 domain-containing protein [Gemmatirosa sp.]